MTTIADVLKPSFVLKVKVGGKTVRGVLSEPKFDQDKGFWNVTVSTNFDGKDYSSIFPIDEVIQSVDNGSILKVK